MDQRAANDLQQRDHPGEAVSKRTKPEIGSLPEWWYGTEGNEQIGLPFTQTPHQFFEWLMYLGLLEIRILGVVIRLTFGWHRKWTRPLSASDFCEITSHRKTSVLEALTNLHDHGILDRRRLSRRQPYCYGLIVRELEPLKEVPAPAKQGTLPYNVHSLSGSENRTSQKPRVVQKTEPLSGSENRTSQPPVLSCIKESNTHKETCESRFSRDERVQHMEAHGFGLGWLYNSEDGRFDFIIERERAEAEQRAQAKGEPTIRERLRREGAI